MLFGFLLGLLFYFLLFLLSVAYLTLYERHLLGLSQSRLGPSKASFRGALQPLLDALKLLQKCPLRPLGSDAVYYSLMPIAGFGLLFVQMLLLPPFSSFLGFVYSGLLLLCLVGALVYTTFFIGFYSTSKYSYIGALRSGVQSISYEVTLFFLFFSFLRLGGSYGVSSSALLVSAPLFLLLVFSCLAELGRAPFDFTEGESELVSGYNLEFGGVLFVFLFLSEYGFMLFFSGLLSSVCWGWPGGFSIAPFMVLTAFLLCRSVLPRYRYDLLMFLFWAVLLPSSMQMFFIYYSFSCSCLSKFGQLGIISCLPPHWVFNVLANLRGLLVSSPTSKYLSLGWNLGSFLGVVLAVQLITGLLLTLYYSNEAASSFSSVDYICREVHLGWLVRTLHMNGASLFFFLMYLHLFKALFFSSHRLTAVWATGFLILALSMASAFLGYVLVNAQMSYWAAVVITSLLSVLPGGGDLLLWVWGGYSVGAATLKMCFTLHYLLPWVVAAVVVAHLVLLHEVGSTTPLSYSGSLTKGWFHPYYLSKDGLSLVPLFLFYAFIFVFPYSLGDPEMFIEANVLVSPLHIVPEWYFLFAYAMLRAQPVKVAGVLLLVSSLALPALLCLAPGSGSSLVAMLRVLVWGFISNGLVLSWLGQCPVEAPYTSLSMLSTSLYFLNLSMISLSYNLEGLLFSSAVLEGRPLFQSFHMMSNSPRFYNLAHDTGSSPYPLWVSCHLLYLVSSFLLSFKMGGSWVPLGGVVSLLLLISSWVQDIVSEGLSGAHNYLVQDGLKLSFLLFLFSEFMFFFGVFWTFLDASLSPVIDIGGVWPPVGITPASPFGLPLLGTALLLSSGVSVTWSHCQLLANQSAASSLLLTVFLAACFVALQVTEYRLAMFTISDSIYGTLFYFSTGFHGFHVLCGGLLLLHCWYRMSKSHFSSLHHIELEASIIYWHFVDVVWLGLYLLVYWWGS